MTIKPPTNEEMNEWDLVISFLIQKQRLWKKQNKIDREQKHSKDLGKLWNVGNAVWFEDGDKKGKALGEIKHKYPSYATVSVYFGKDRRNRNIPYNMLRPVRTREDKRDLAIGKLNANDKKSR